MTMPNFLVIGAAKSGTTSLHRILDQHPYIYMCPVKEPRFFEFDGSPPNFKGPFDDYVNSRSVYDIDDYRRLFSRVSHETAIGEVSPGYLPSERAATSIRKYEPNARLIAILRNPVDRAYSHYMMKVRDGVESISFEEALRHEPQRIRDHWRVGRYFQQGLYYEQLKRYYDCFPVSQIRVYLFDDFKDDALSVVQDIFHFLGVDVRFTPDVKTIHNISGMIRHPVLRYIWGRSNRLRRYIRPFIPERLRRRCHNYVTSNLIRPEMNTKVRTELMQRYRSEIDHLEILLDRDLSIWRGSPAPRASAEVRASL